MKTHPTVSATGLENLGIRLQAPYGAKSIHQALIINEGPHHLMAFEVLFEFVSKTGNIETYPRIVGYDKLLQAQPKEREALFKQKLGVAPHTKLLVSIAMDGPNLVPISNTLPTLTKTAVGVDNAEISERYEKINIRLNAVVLENGDTFGPATKQFADYLQKASKEGKQ